MLCSMLSPTTRDHICCHSPTKCAFRFIVLFLLLTLAFPCFCQSDQNYFESIRLDAVKKWASGFSRDVHLLARLATCEDQLTKSFEERGAVVKKRKTEETLRKIGSDINKLFNNRRQIVANLVKDAERKAAEYSREQLAKSKNVWYQNVPTTQANYFTEPATTPVDTIPIELNNTESSEMGVFTTENVEPLTEMSNFISPSQETLAPTAEEDIVDNEDELPQSSTPLEEGDDLIDEPTRLRRDVLRDNRLVSKVFTSEYLGSTNGSENQFNNLVDDLEQDVYMSQSGEESDIVASALLASAGLELSEDEFLTFPDVKKIYAPDRELNDTSIPRNISGLKPEDAEERLWWERWKAWTPLETIEDPFFPGYQLNFSMSGLHVPLNVYPQHNNTRNAIQWSSRLDENFRKNRLQDPSLNFQFFCSIDGFLRIHPLIKWRVPRLFTTFDGYEKMYASESVGKRRTMRKEQGLPEAHKADPEEANEDAEEEGISDDDIDENDPSRALDLYDCRMRDWFIKAAAPPKDIIVMSDSSGSMRGERSNIAQNVIINILETLTENDFVSVLRFNTRVFPIHPCFGTRFVQADKRNVASFKDEILEMSDDDRLEEAEKAANFTEAFQVAFRMFEDENRIMFGSNCSKALMIITDGSQQDLNNVLSKISPRDRSVRIFTYLIGREVTDTKSTESIACNNFGYYTHLKDLAEVKEEVQLYVPVLSRPIGMHAKDATVVCSALYADPQLPPLTDMVWEMHENRLFYEIYYRSQGIETAPNAHLIRRQRSIPGVTNAPGVSNPVSSQTQVEADLMVTLAMPVFNMTNGTKTSWDLLGVAGVDIPIRDILREVPFHRLGVGGYVFIVNNNGFLIYHPDMRPVYKGFLKRFYSALDLLELELMDDDTKPRTRNEKMMEMRTSMVDEKTNCSLLRAKIHYDSMKRVTTRENHYCWVSIDETLFTLGISLPNQYGHYYVKAVNDIRPHKNLMKHFKGRETQWSVHPKWHYCWDNLNHEKIKRQEWDQPLLMEMQPREVIEHMVELNHLSPQRFAWHLYDKPNAPDNHDLVEFYCNRELVESLLFDARATKIDPEASLKNRPKRLSHAYPHNVFVSTRSGFTRYFDLTPSTYAPRHRVQRREQAIDELIYKRTVEYASKSHVDHYVFQIESEFDQLPASATLVTIARAYFMESQVTSNSLGSQKVPKRRPSIVNTSSVEQVPYMLSGLQLSYHQFSELFFRHESNCDIVHCEIDCFRPDINCYLLDDNGYIVLSVNDFDSKRNLDNRLDKDAGRHLYELDAELFADMADDKRKIFRKVEVFDFQGICEKPKDSQSSAGIRPLSVFGMITKLVGFFSELLLRLAHTLQNSAKPVKAWNEFEEEDDEETYRGGIPNRTIVTACLKTYELFELHDSSSFSASPARFTFERSMACEEAYILYKLEQSNLLLLISQNECMKMRKKREPRIEEEAETLCQHHEPMYRKRPHMYETHMCYPNEQEVNLHHCGARANANALMPVWIILILSIITQTMLTLTKSSV